MATGLAAYLANGWLNTIRGGAAGSSFTAPAAVYTKLHLGDPGAAAATSPSTNTTRVATTFGAASAGALALSNTPTWSSWANGTEVISHVSVWDASTAGNFLLSGALTSSKTVQNGDTLTITSFAVSLAPLAA